MDVSDFNAVLAAAAEIREAGGSGFVRHIIVENFTDALAGRGRNHRGQRAPARVRVPRAAGERTPGAHPSLPSRQCLQSMAEYPHLVLYSAEQCAKEGEDIGDADWGIVSINAGMTPEVTLSTPPPRCGTPWARRQGATESLSTPKPTRGCSLVTLGDRGVGARTNTPGKPLVCGLGSGIPKGIALCPTITLLPSVCSRA